MSSIQAAWNEKPSTRAAHRSLLVSVVVLAVLATACGGRGSTEEAGSEARSGAAATDGDGTDAASTYPDPGIGDDFIRLGASIPQSGPASAYAAIGQAHEAYFAHVNDNGGIDGRMIEYVAHDDAYDPAKTLENARRLVEQDQVFATFGHVGTPTNLAIRDYLNEQRVPQLFIGSADTSFGAEHEAHPWTMGFLPAFSTEASIISEFIAAEVDDPEVAILYQNDDFGQGILDAFKASLDERDIEIVAEETYEVTDASVDSQIVNLQSSDANVLIDWSNPKQAAQAIRKAHEIGWEPMHFISSSATSVQSVLEPAGLEASEGVMATFYTKDPSDPQWSDNPGMQQYKRIIGEYGNGLDANDQIAVLGYAQAQLMAESLRQMEEPTRQGLLDAVTSLDGVELDVLLPGVTVTTGPDDYFPLETEQISEFNGERWTAAGDPVSLEGQTPVGN